MWSDTIERYLREGRGVSGGCGASSAQVGLQNSQIQFYNQLTANYAQQYSENQQILQELTKSFNPILAAGPDQQGYSPAELQSLQSEATTGVGQNYSAAQKALALEQGAQGGGNSFVPSGAASEQRAQLAESAAQQQSGEQLGIEQQNWAQGLSNYQFAANELAGVAAQYNPEGQAGAATGAGSSAATTANEVTQANQSWMQLAAGALGAAGGALGGGSLGKIVGE
jgi:hypothetical protein